MHKYQSTLRSGEKHVCLDLMQNRTSPMARLVCWIDYTLDLSLYLPATQTRKNKYSIERKQTEVKSYALECKLLARMVDVIENKLS